MIRRCFGETLGKTKLLIFWDRQLAETGFPSRFQTNGFLRKENRFAISWSYLRTVSHRQNSNWILENDILKVHFFYAYSRNHITYMNNLQAETDDVTDFTHVRLSGLLINRVETRNLIYGNISRS